MTVYTVIGYITNAILTFEPLPIPSNLSGGPQLRSKRNLSAVKFHFENHAKYEGFCIEGLDCILHGARKFIRLHKVEKKINFLKEPDL